MIDKKDIKEFLDQFVKSNVEIILDNQMHYSGKFLNYADVYVKLCDKYSNIVFIVIDKISSIRIKEEI